MNFQMLQTFTEKAVTAKLCNEILACNEKTAEYGLQLTEKQAKALIAVRNEALHESRRVEFGRYMIDKLIKVFSTSPYLDHTNYYSMLQELLALFYTFKNETEDRLDDRRLLHYMKTLFDGDCGGSIECLAVEGLQKLQNALYDGTIAREEVKKHEKDIAAYEAASPGKAYEMRTAYEERERDYYGTDTGE